MREIVCCTERYIRDATAAFSLPSCLLGKVGSADPRNSRNRDQPAIALTKASQTVSADEPVGQSSPNAEAHCNSNGVEPKRRLPGLLRESNIVAYTSELDSGPC